MRPNTAFTVNAFVFNGQQDGSERSFLSLFKGGFRAITGLVGQLNKQNYKVTTPVATLGIRGTDHEIILVTEGEPMAQIVPIGIYSKVNMGETILTTDKGSIHIAPNQMGFANSMNQMPQLQTINTNLFMATPSPDVQARIDKREDKKPASTTSTANEAKVVGDAPAAPARVETSTQEAPSVRPQAATTLSLIHI